MYYSEAEARGGLKTTKYNLKKLKMNVQEKIADNAKNARISEVAAFTKSQPQGFDTDGILDAGDIIIFPTTMPKVMKQTFGMRRNANGDPEENYAEFIVVEVVNSKGESRGVNFFPSSLTKNVWPAEKGEDGKVVTITEKGPMNPKGSAVDLYKSVAGKGTDEKTDMQLGMELLLGKKVKVENKTPVEIQRWRNGETVNELRTTNLFEYNIV